MELRERLAEIRDSLGDQPRRVVASSLGVLWGSAAMVLLLGTGTGFRDYMKVELGGYGRGAVDVYPSITSSGYTGFRAGVPVRIAAADARAAEAENPELVEAVLAEHQSRERVWVEANGRFRLLDVSGTEARFAYYRRFEIAHGRFFDADDVRDKRPVVVLGHEAAEELFDDIAAAPGQTLRMEGRSYRVVGVSAPKGKQYAEVARPDNRLVLIPISVAQARMGFDERSVSLISIYPRDTVGARMALRGVLGTIGGRSGFHPEDGEAVKWFDRSEMLGLVDLLYAGFLVFLAIAGTMTLLVGAVGIANYHLATISERTVEIAVAKALGARNRGLVLQTVAESLLVSGGAVAAGVALGLLGCVGLALIPGFPAPAASALVVGVTFLATLSVGVVASILPALRVERMEIALALRAST